MRNNKAANGSQQGDGKVFSMKAQNLSSDFCLPSLSDLGDLFGFTNAFDTMAVCNREKKILDRRSYKDNCIITLMFQCGGRFKKKNQTTKLKTHLCFWVCNQFIL